MVSTKEAVRSHYATALQRCLDIWGKLNDGDWQGRWPGCKWTARDYLAHLVTNEEMEILPTTSHSIAGEAVEIPGLASRLDIDAFNQAGVDSVADLTPAELLERLKAVFQSHIQLLEGLIDEDLKRPAWNAGLRGEPTIADLFSIGFLHLPVHYQDIRRAIRRSRKLPHWMELASPTEVHEALSQAFAIMPTFYWPEKGGDLRATYLFDLEGEGGGQWWVAIDGGECTSGEGLPPQTDCRFRTRPAYWMDLQTKELNPLWALLSRRLRLGGKMGLALKLDKLFAIT
jgi:SCP-2 sterol transfer family/DinB superfamily